MNLRNRWNDIFRLSKSKDEFERTTALATAVGALEVALTALGVPRDPRQDVVIDGTRFGEDKKYTLAITKQQADPLFFVNISDALLRYDARRSSWSKKPPKIFQRLATIKAQLQTENVIRPHRARPLAFRTSRRTNR